MATAYNPRIVDDGLKIYLDFSNTRCYPGSGTVINNLVGNSVGYLKNNTFVSNGIATTGGAQNNQANNVGDRIDINTTSSGVDRFGANNFSIFFWVNQINSGRMFSTGSAGTGTGNSDNCIWQLWIDTGQFFWWNTSGGNTNAISATGAWHSIGTWQLIGFTYSYNENSNNIVRCYRNDSEAFTASLPTATHSFIDRSNQSNLQWTLGGGYFGSCFNQNRAANFSNFWLYNRTLSPLEIKQNFNATRGRFGV